MTDAVSIRAFPPKGKAYWLPNDRHFGSCPKCKQLHNCKISICGGWVWCGRCRDGCIRVNKGNQGLYRLTGEQRRTIPSPPARQRPQHESADWEAMAAAFVAAAEAKPGVLSTLADQLRVSVDSLRRLRVGIKAGASGVIYTFPETDAGSKAVGINQRLPDGSKRAIKGSTRGIYFDRDNLATATGPVYIVEGASDTAAGLTMGYRIVGRMNNRHAAFLDELLRDEREAIIVVGENDQKPDGRWPGMDGARETAKVLANKLGLTIFVSQPPRYVKDMRAYLGAVDPWGADPLAAGRKLAECLAATLEVVEPDVDPDDLDLEDDDLDDFWPNSDDAPRVRVGCLEEWRGQSQRQRLQSVGKPGIYYDSSPPGAGKSYSDRVAIGALGAGTYHYPDLGAHSVAETSLIALPTHQNLREWEQDCRESCGDDFSIAIYPQRTDENCENTNLAEYVDAIGLQASAVVCPTCKYRSGCGFLAAKAAFDDAKHQGVTHARLAIQPERMHGKKYIAIHENPVAIIRPMKSATFEEMERLAAALKQGKQLSHDDNILELSRCFGERLAVTQFVLAKFKEAERLQETVEIKPPPGFGVKHNGLQPTTWRAIEGNGQLEKPFGDAMAIVDALATGKLHRAAIAWNDTPEMQAYLRKNAKAGEPMIHAVWDNSAALPDDATIWISDATSEARSREISDLEEWRAKNGEKPNEQLPYPGCPDNIESLVGRPVRDCSLFDRLPRLVEGVQWARDVTQSTSENVVASLLAGVVWRHQTARKIGFLGHRYHVDKLFRRKKSPLDAETRSRFSADHINHFGSGADRGSNEWLGCDLIVVCGTPRVSPAAVRGELIRRGDIAAANRDGEWHTYQWEARTAEGEPAFVTAYGYADDVWKAAHVALTQAALIQAVGRARLNCPDGVPVIVLSNEPGLGLPVAVDCAAAKVKETSIRAASVLERLGGSRTAEEVGRVMGVSRTTAWRYLKDAAKLEWVSASRKRWTITAAWTERAQVSNSLINIIGKVKPSDVSASATATTGIGGQASTTAPPFATTTAPAARPSVPAPRPAPKPAPFRRLPKRLAATLTITLPGEAEG